MMAPFSSMLKSKTRRKHRPATPPSPGSFVSPRSPTWHLQSFSTQSFQDDLAPHENEWTTGDYAENSVMDIRNNASSSRKLLEVDPYDVGPRPRTAPARTSSDYNEGDRPKLVLDLPPRLPSAPNTRSSGRPRPQSILNVVHTPVRDSTFSSEGSTYSSSEVHSQIMNFAFPLPPVGTPTSAGGNGDRPILPPLPKFNLGRHQSWEELGMASPRKDDVEVRLNRVPAASFPC